MLSEDLRHMAAQIRWFSTHGITPATLDRFATYADNLADQAKALEGGHLPTQAGAGMVDDDTNVISLAQARGWRRDGRS